MLDPELKEALDALLGDPEHWVHAGTVTPAGEPHVTPVMLAYDDDHLYLSLTGRAKKANLQANPRVCLSMARDGDIAHVILWGDVELREDAWAQERWEFAIRHILGDEGLKHQQRQLSPEGTSLGVVTPVRWRIFGLGAVPDNYVPVY
jgi:general stress protein 26